MGVYERLTGEAEGFGRAMGEEEGVVTREQRVVFLDPFDEGEMC